MSTQKLKIIMLTIIICLLLIVTDTSVGETKTPPICPKWAFEPWIWEDNGNTRGAITGLVDGYQTRNIPVGAVIIDSPWETAYNSFDWDLARYPDPQGMITELHSKGVRVIMWITGAMNRTGVDVPVQKAPAYDYVIAEGFTVNNGQEFKWWKGRGVHIDFTNQDAVDWFGTQMAKHHNKGIDGWKVDQAEQYLGSSVSTSIGTIPKSEFKPYYYAAVADQSLKYKPDSLIICRPYSHQGGYAARIDTATVGWGGDYSGDLSGLRKQMKDLYRSAETGYGTLAVEVGGFTGQAPTKNQLIRYAQFGALMPVMENGGMNGGLTNHLPWHHDEETVEIYRYYATLHSELAPYLFSTSVDSHLNGGSMVKSSDLAKAHHLLGDQIFASLVVYSENNKTVFLPAQGHWIDYWNEDEFWVSGASMTIDVPMNRVPLFLKAGAIIPMNVRNDVTGHGDDSYSGKETILVYPYGQSSYLYHRCNGSGIEYHDVAISMNEQSGVLSVNGAEAVSYRFRIKSFSPPQNVQGADSWTYDQGNHYIIVNKQGTSFQLQINGLEAYSSKTARETEPIEPASLVSHYTFDGDATNSVAGAPDGTIVGSPQFIPGHDGTVSGAIQFNGGAEDYVDVTVGGLPNSASALRAGTITFWINASSTGKARMFGSANTGANTNLQLSLHDNSAMRLYIRPEGDSTYTHAYDMGTTNSSWNDGQWHHIAIIWDVDQSSVGAIYIDGVSAAVSISEGTGAADTYAAYQNPLTIGAFNNRGAIVDEMDGSLDDFRVYDGMLTEAEIAVLISCGSQEYNKMDFNLDCAVDLLDFELFVNEWLKSSIPC